MDFIYQAQNVSGAISGSALFQAALQGAVFGSFGDIRGPTTATMLAPDAGPYTYYSIPKFMQPYFKYGIKVSFLTQEDPGLPESVMMELYLKGKLK